MQIINISPKREKEIIPQRLMSVLPTHLCDSIKSVCGGGVLEEIRLRCGRYSSVVRSGENIMLDTVLERTDMNAILVGMCGGSLYAYSDTINQGYISLPDGIRVGICGKASCDGDKIIGVYDVTSMSIRIPHKHRRTGHEICMLLQQFGMTKGVLIYSPPGVGKTTLLRSVAAELSGGDRPLRTVVIDTRGELSFAIDDKALCLDVLSGYPRRTGVDIATRCMNAQVIICDEIGDYEEAFALVSSHNCGVPLVASAHAGDIYELMKKSGIRLLHEAGIFGAYVGISRSGNMDFRYDTVKWKEADMLC